MTNPRPRNIAASVHQRLLDKSKDSARPFNELFQYYAIERFLYRLSRSSHAGKFILKGALMLLVWEVRASRSTMDIDMLGRMKNNPEAAFTIIPARYTLSVEHSSCLAAGFSRVISNDTSRWQ
jgi:hypothetical protein